MKAIVTYCDNTLHKNGIHNTEYTIRPNDVTSLWKLIIVYCLTKLKDKRQEKLKCITCL